MDKENLKQVIADVLREIKLDTPADTPLSSTSEQGSPVGNTAPPAATGIPSDAVSNPPAAAGKAPSGSITLPEAARKALPQGRGIFPTLGEALSAAHKAQRELVELGLDKRREIIAAMRRIFLDNAAMLAEQAARETGMGSPAYKTLKNQLAAEKTPGVEDVQPAVFTDEHGLTLVERAPYGVIGTIIPSTNPTSTVVCNAIGMISGGNTAVFNPHPAARECSALAVSLLAEAIEKAGGPANCLTVMAEPTIASAEEMMRHPQIALLAVTGGPGVVKAAMGSGKKVIAAGPGNPPCVVDESADIEKAGADIVHGAGFDHNIVCICEKEVIAVDSIADALKSAMLASGAYLLSAEETRKVTELILIKPGGPGSEGVVNKKYVGKSPRLIASHIGVYVPDDVRVLLCEVPISHPLMWTEQLMPVLPLTRVKDADAAIALAFEMEHGCRHTAMMHSRNIDKLSAMARLMNCSLFVKNGPCYAGLGMGGAGFPSFTIASPTGEGLTRPHTFTRERRCTLVDRFRIV
ncbi:MAG: aldehyde dehydrogenase EutE [Spirochaeta sp. LUC14_002_19_P3]|nr:MAG: aldehyde dehydrogenase EutE [Spirochaeta sp. LUC14_002_19_P3]